MGSHPVSWISADLLTDGISATLRAILNLEAKPEKFTQDRIMESQEEV